MIVFAHAGHWALNVLEVSPFFIMVGWLGLTTWRERRRAEREEGKEGAGGSDH